MKDYQHDKVVPYEGSKVNKKVQVEQMFDNIAPKYDKINRILSLRVDVLWRKKVVKILKDIPNAHFLDVATGTADLAIMLASLKPKHIYAVDLSRQMLDYGVIKVNNAKLQDIITLQKEDSEALSFDDNTFDAATVSFGVRNFENLNKGLSEIYRVIKPGGRLVILEFSKVKTFPIKQLYSFYFRYITPMIGKIFSKDNSAYTYLPNSVQAFPEGEEMCRILQEIGFKQSTCTTLSFGIASIYTSVK